jgi:hypothetical protein
MAIQRGDIDKKYVLKSGMLKKRSKDKIGKATWKEKWFVLRPDSLTYYKSAVVCIFALHAPLFSLAHRCAIPANPLLASLTIVL